MSYPVTLGGVVFDVPSLPWRLVKELQPALLGWIDDHGALQRADGALRLKADSLSALADLVFKAVSHSPQGKGFTRETFDELTITALEMAGAVNPILRACGLKFEARAGAVDPKA